MRNEMVSRFKTFVSGLWLAGRGLGVVGFVLAAAGCGNDPGYSKQAPTTNGSASARDVRQADEKVAKLERDAARLITEIQGIEESNREKRHVVYHNLACVYRQAGRFPEAESAYLEALRLDPKAPDTQLGLGLLYDQDLRQPDKARTCFERFLELSPDSPHAADVRTWIGRLNKHVGEPGVKR